MKNAVLCFIIFAFCNAVFFCGCGSNVPPTEPKDVAIERAQMVQIAKDAYVYGFPLVLMEITKRQMTNPFPGTDNVPVNQIMHIRSAADDKVKDFIMPNADMLYSFAWLDLSKEPMLLEIPEISGRYAFFNALNGWTDIIASDGSRATAGKARKIAFTGPRWEGALPEGFEEYRSASNMIWWTGRIQANGKQDAETNVRKIQNEIKLYPLSYYGKKYAAPKGRPDQTIVKKAPLEQVTAMSISEFFNILNQLMVNNPPYPADAAILDKILDLGVAPGMRFEATTFDFDTQEAFKEIPKWFAGYMENLRNEGIDKGWVYRYGFGNYGSDYRARAKAAYFALGASFDADAVYMYSGKDIDGEKYDGGKKYVLHFDKDELPAVKAFWSISALDESGSFAKNALNRFSVGSSDKLHFNKDGSLDIYIQKDNPGKEKQSNWLPSPSGAFNIVLGCYQPDESLLEGKWKIPAVNKGR